MSPGPKPIATRELFLEAGRAAATSVTTEPSLAALLNLRMEDVLVYATQALRDSGLERQRTLTAPGLYKHWTSFNEYLKDLVATVFPVDDMVPSSLTGDRPLEEELTSHMRQDLRHAQEHNSALYFGLFAGTDHPEVRDALQGVYRSFDEHLVPALSAILPSAVDSEQIAVLLTAVTEGLALRSLVQDDVVTDGTIRTVAAVIARGLARP